jgi:excisionase family DNA binding protein
VELLTVPEVAAELRVSVRTVLAFIASGELRAVQGIGRGRGYRIRREWVDAFLRSHEKRALSGPDEQASARAPKRAISKTPTFTSAREARLAFGLIRGGKP